MRQRLRKHRGGASEDCGPITPEVLDEFLEAVRDQEGTTLSLIPPGLPTRIICDGLLEQNIKHTRSLRGLKFIPHYQYSAKPRDPALLQIDLNLDRISDLRYRYDDEQGLVSFWSAPFGAMELVVYSHEIDRE